jgi:penicillin-binding protein 1B
MPRTEPRPTRRTASARSRSTTRRRASSAKQKRPPTLFGRIIRTLLLTGFIAALIIAAGIAGYLRYLDTTITSTFEGRRWSVPAVIYAQPLELFPGALLSMRSVMHELDRLGNASCARWPWR